MSNGVVDAPEGTEYADVAIVTCNVGYQRAGSVLISCQDGPSWSDTPTCTIKGNFKFRVHILD